MFYDVATLSRTSPITTLKTEDFIMRIKLTSVLVDNQDKALKFYTDVLGLLKKV